MCFYATLRFMTRHNMNDHWSCKTNWHYSAQTKIMNVEIVILWNCPKELFCKEIKESITTFAVATATMLDENHSNVSFVLVGEGSKLFLFNISLLNQLCDESLKCSIPNIAPMFHLAKFPFPFSIQSPIFHLFYIKRNVEALI